MPRAAVLPGVDLAEVESYLAALPGVTAVRNLHVWPVSITDIALTARLVIPGGHPGHSFLAEAAAALSARFSIDYAPLEIESSANPSCAATAAPISGSW